MGFLSVWKAEMSLLTISRSSFLFSYPITCHSNDSFSSYGAFSPVEPFSENKCLFHSVWLVLKPEMIMFDFSILLKIVDSCFQYSYLFIFFSYYPLKFVYQGQYLRDFLLNTRQFIHFFAQIVDRLFKRSDVIRITRYISNRRKHKY